MRIVDKVLDFPNGSWGEDCFILGENSRFIGVLDGSSPITKLPMKGYHSQAEWFVQLLSNKIVEDSTIRKFAEVCQHSVDELWSENNEILSNMSSENLPCSMLSAMELEDNFVNFYVLGDCGLAFKRLDGVSEVITDTRVNYYSDKTKQVRLGAIANGVDSLVAVQKQMTENRACMNVEGGFWTASFKGYFEIEMLTSSVPVSQLDCCLLYSDGFARGFEVGLYSYDSILTQSISLESALKMLRDWESTSSLEVKRHDDVSAILVKF